MGAVWFCMEAVHQFLNRIFQANGCQLAGGIISALTVLLLGVPLNVVLGFRQGGYGFFLGASLVFPFTTFPLYAYWLTYRVKWRCEAREDDPVI